MKLPFRVLVIDDDENALCGIEELLRAAEHDVTTSSSYEEAKVLLAEFTWDLFITDVRLRSYNGLHLVMKVRSESPDIAIVIMTGYDDAMMEYRGAPVQRAIRPQADQGCRVSRRRCTQPEHRPSSAPLAAQASRRRVPRHRRRAAGLGPRCLLRWPASRSAWRRCAASELCRRSFWDWAQPRGAAGVVVPSSRAHRPAVRRNTGVRVHPCREHVAHDR